MDTEQLLAEMESTQTLVKRMRAIALFIHGAALAALGAGLCAAFLLAWTGATALADTAATGAYAPHASEATGMPAQVGLVLGCAVGLTLLAAGLSGVLRAVIALVTAARGSGAAAPVGTKPAPLGSATTHLLRGFRHAGALLPSPVSRALATALPWALLVALTLSTEPRAMFATPLLAFLGSLLGRGLYAMRPGTRWARPLVVAGIPLLLAVPPLLASLRPGQWPIPLAFLIGAEIGAHLGELRERTVGPSLRVLAVECAGVTHVGDPDGVRFDVRPLLRRPSSAERRALASHRPDLVRSGEAVRVRLISVAAALTPIGLLALGYGMTQQAIEGGEDSAAQLLGMSAIFALLALGCGILIWWSTRAKARLTRPRDHVALALFAEANGLQYLPEPKPSPDRVDVLTRTMLATGAGGGILIANRESADGNALGDGRSYFGGVCALDVATPLPNIRLRSTQHRMPAFSAYAAPARDQRLSLEGDFDRYFELSAPKGYERDALYLFTPDVMAWLIDDVRGFDVELIDRQIVLRSRRDAVTRDPADWDRLASALTAIGARITQWERWRDDREPAAGDDARLRLETHGRAALVGPGGRRLRLGIGAGTVFAVLFAGLYLALTLAANSI